MEKNKFSKIDILKKVLNILFKIMYDVLICFCILLIIVVVWQRVTDSNKSIYGYRLFRIISGSMVPEYNIDEVVVCKEVDTRTLKIGDIVVYRGRVGELNNKLVMHEIIDITNNNGELIFSVKGIQNLLGDPNVSSSQILGKVIFKSSLLTYLYALATHTSSAFIIVMILVINVFIAFLPTKKEAKKIIERRNKKNLKLDNAKNEEEIVGETNTNLATENKKNDEISETTNDEKINEESNLENKTIEDEISLKTEENETENNEKMEENEAFESEETEANETEILKEKNRKLQEENKKLRAKVRKIKEENKKEKK